MDQIKEIAQQQGVFKEILDEFDDAILIEKGGHPEYANSTFLNYYGFLSEFV